MAAQRWSAPAGRHGRGRWGALGALVLAASTVLGACGGGSSAPSFDRAAAPAQIQHAYGVLFNFADPSVSAKVAVIENGASLRSALHDALSTPLAGLAKGAKVTKTTLLDAATCKEAGVRTPCAKVRYDLLGAKGSVLFSGSSGYAVYEKRWLVAHSTICGLLETMNQTLGRTGTPEGC